MISKKSATSSLLLVAAIVQFGCKGSTDGPRVKSEAPPPIANTSPRIIAAVVPIPPPEAGEVKSTVERIFKGAVVIDNTRDRYFLAGDFNGDHSQDLAVVVKTSQGMAEKLNDEFAAWILVDPGDQANVASKLSKHPQLDPNRQQVHIDDGEVLLAVIHGFESNGWRDSQATQIYVLKNAVGVKINAREREQVHKAKDVRTPDLRGDVIEQTIAGKSGFLYYNGARYAWYDPRTFSPGPARRMVHDKPAPM